MTEAKDFHGIVEFFSDEDFKVDPFLGYPLAYSELCHSINSDGTLFHLYTLGPPSQYLPYELSNEEVQKKDELEALFPIHSLDETEPTELDEFHERLWNSCPTIENAGFDPTKFRVDCYGNVMYRDADIGSPLAWTVDHWFPRSRSGMSVYPNLRLINSRASLVKGDRLEFCVPHWELQVGISVEYFLSVFSTTNHEFRGRALTFFFKGGELSLFQEIAPLVPNLYNFPAEWKERKKEVGKAVAAMEANHLQRPVKTLLTKEVDFKFFKSGNASGGDAPVDTEHFHSNSNSNSVWNLDDLMLNVEDGDVDALDILIATLDADISRKEKLKIELLLKRSMWVKNKLKERKTQSINLNGSILSKTVVADADVNAGDANGVGVDVANGQLPMVEEDENENGVGNDSEDEEDVKDLTFLHLNENEEKDAEFMNENELEGGNEIVIVEKEIEEESKKEVIVVEDGYEEADQAVEEKDVNVDDIMNKNKEIRMKLRVRMSPEKGFLPNHIQQEDESHLSFNSIKVEEENEKRKAEEIKSVNESNQIASDDLVDSFLPQTPESANHPPFIRAIEEKEEEGEEEMAESHHFDCRDRFISNSKPPVSSTPPISPSSQNTDIIFNDVDHRSMDFKESTEKDVDANEFVHTYAHAYLHAYADQASEKDDGMEPTHSEADMENHYNETNELNKEDKARWRSNVPSPPLSPFHSPLPSSLPNRTQPNPPLSSPDLPTDSESKSLDTDTLALPEAKVSDAEKVEEVITAHKKELSLQLAARQNLIQIQNHLNQKYYQAQAQMQMQMQSQNRLYETYLSQKEDLHRSQAQSNFDQMWNGMQKMRNSSSVSKQKSAISANHLVPKSPPQNTSSQVKYNVAALNQESRQRNHSYSERPASSNPRLITRSAHSSPDILNNRGMVENQRGQLDIRFTTSESSSNDSGDNESMSGGGSMQEAMNSGVTGSGGASDHLLHHRIPHPFNQAMSPSKTKFVEENIETLLGKSPADLECRKNFQKWKSRQAAKVVSSSPPLSSQVWPSAAQKQPANTQLHATKTLAKQGNGSNHSSVALIKKSIVQRKGSRGFVVSLDEAELNSAPEILLVRPLKFYNSVAYGGNVETRDGDQRAQEQVSSLGSGLGADLSDGHKLDRVQKKEEDKKHGGRNHFKHHNSSANEHQQSDALIKSFYKRAFEPMQ